MVYRSDCCYLPYSIHFSEFMPILFTRKQTKHGNAQSSPFSYNMKMAVDGYYACKALTVRERFLNVFTPHSSLLFLFYSLELNWAITFWCNFSWHLHGLLLIPGVKMTWLMTWVLILWLPLPPHPSQCTGQVEGIATWPTTQDDLTQKIQSRPGKCE